MTIWNKEQVEKGLGAISGLRQPLLVHIKSLLDEYYGQPHSQRYYDVTLGDWVEQFLHLYYFAASELVERNQPYLDGQPVNIPLSHDTWALTLRATRCTDVIESMQWVIRYLLDGQSLSCSNFVVYDAGHSKRTVRSRMMAGLLRLLGPSTPQIIICCPYFKCDKQEWGRALLRWHRKVLADDLSFESNQIAAPDRRWRVSKAIDPSGRLDALGIVLSMCSLYLPIAFVEGQENIQKRLAALQLPHPRAIYSANALFHHTMFKILAAGWQESGTQLLYHQHGGGYGIDRENVLEDYEVRVADRYYTWGWSSAANVKPLSPPPLGGRRSSTGPLIDVLLVCLETPRFPYRLWYQPMPGTMELVNTDTVDFVRVLGRPLGTLVRLAQHSFGWGLREAIVKAVPNIAFDDHSSSSLQRFAESRVVVHNYIGTSWLESLAMNIPTVCFYSEMVHAFRDDAASYIADLEDTGVLHRSGKEAACFVKALGRDVDSWWQRGDVQDARQRFVNSYARFSSSWIDEWEAEFDSLR